MEKKVLLIDDEASLRRSVSMGLMQKGYQTEPCENGMKALGTLETYQKNAMPFSCAVVDIRLPDIDGFKLLKVIKVNYPQLPVIIITGYDSDAVSEQAKAADAFLKKPFDMDQLAKLLEQLEPKSDVVPAAARRRANGQEGVGQHVRSGFRRPRRKPARYLPDAVLPPQRALLRRDEG